MNKYSYPVAAIKERVTISQAAEHYGITFNRAGFAPCPFHQEKTPSFSVKNGFAYCFGCGWNGDVIDLVKGLLGLDFKATIVRINDDFALGLPVGRRATLRDRKQAREYVRADRKRHEERRAKELAQLGYDTIWNNLIAELYRVEHEINQHAPQSIDEELSDQFIAAILERERINQRLDRFEQHTFEEIWAARNGNEGG